MKLSSCKIHEKDLLEFYKHCNGDSTIEQFRGYCKDLLLNSRAPNQQLLRQIDTMSRDRLILSMNNFIFKGHGFGVIK